MAGSHSLKQLLDNIGSCVLDTIKTCGGCPHELVTDLGTENKIMAFMQAFFRDEENITNVLHRSEIKGLRVIGHSTDETGQLGG